MSPVVQEGISDKLPSDILTKIRRISITTAQIVQEAFAGRYQSVFKGRGMEFDSVREYQPGDEIRSIDWNVTARSGKLQVKKFVEERELTVMLMLDGSASCRFGSGSRLKSDLAAEICAIFAFSAVFNNDKAGLVIFTDKIEKAITPKKGRGHVMRLVREALLFKTASGGTDIAKALEYVNRIVPRKTVCFVISDFLADGYQGRISIMRRRHDIVAVRILDKRELELPDAGLVSIDDAETGKQILIDTSKPSVRESYNRQAVERLKKQDDFFLSNGIDCIDIFTDTPYTDSLVHFFSTRASRFRQHH